MFGLTVEMLKIVAPHIPMYLSHLFNEWFDHMKLPMITLVYKGGSKFEATNYRPVSVLPNLS